MRILFVSQEFPPETAWGGIGTYVDVLSEALATKGMEVHVLSAVNGQHAGTVSRAGVTVHRVRAPHVPGPGRVAPEAWTRILLAATVARAIDRLRIEPDVVECPEWKAEGLALALRGTRPLVVRLHSSAGQLFPHTGQGASSGGLDGRLAAWLEDFSARRANAVISTSSNLEEVSAHLRLDNRATHAIPYPVRLPPLASLPDAAEPRVTFVGRLEPRKAPDVVLAAAPRVLAALPAARFVFVGRDVMEPGTPCSSAWLLREAERLGVAHAVELRGQLDRTGVLEELRRASVCAFPSRWESFGNVVAEASAVGRPVATSKIPPFRELVLDGETGRIVGREDPEAWSAALLELLRDRERAQAMGAAGAAHVARLSDPASVADLTLVAHEQAIERWRAGRRGASR
ncbi:MAG TPA: glycosyltransferase family 4 protein [Solirubrobacteraceae bacterium]|nr:glycosyltransferase family 4 protein [Solirubrobacteraceae bacterium]